MKTVKAPVHLRITLPLAGVIVVVCGAITSIRTGDPHWLNRAGAFLAALAAAAIFIQIKAEMEIEKAKEELSKQSGRLHSAGGFMTPVDDLEGRLRMNRIELEGSRLTHGRLTVAAFVVGTAVVGEFLHGFGDLLACYVFNVCPPH